MHSSVVSFVGTPHNFSTNTSLSDLTLDSHYSSQFKSQTNQTAITSKSANEVAVNLKPANQPLVGSKASSQSTATVRPTVNTRSSNQPPINSKTTHQIPVPAKPTNLVSTTAKSASQPSALRQPVSFAPVKASAAVRPVNSHTDVDNKPSSMLPRRCNTGPKTLPQATSIFGASMAFASTPHKPTPTGSGTQAPDIETQGGQQQKQQYVGEQDEMKTFGVEGQFTVAFLLKPRLCFSGNQSSFSENNAS